MLSAAVQRECLSVHAKAVSSQRETWCPTVRKEAAKRAGSSPRSYAAVWISQSPQEPGPLQGLRLRSGAVSVAGELGRRSFVACWSGLEPQAAMQMTAKEELRYRMIRS